MICHIVMSCPIGCLVMCQMVHGLVCGNHIRVTLCYFRLFCSANASIRRTRISRRPQRQQLRHQMALIGMLRLTRGPPKLGQSAASLPRQACTCRVHLCPVRLLYPPRCFKHTGTLCDHLLDIVTLFLTHSHRTHIDCTFTSPPSFFSCFFGP